MSLLIASISICQSCISFPPALISPASFFPIFSHQPLISLHLYQLTYHTFLTPTPFPFSPHPLPPSPSSTHPPPRQALDMKRRLDEMTKTRVDPLTVGRLKIAEDARAAAEARVEKMIRLLNDARAIVKRRAEEAAAVQTTLAAAQVRASRLVFAQYRVLTSTHLIDRVDTRSIS